MNIQPKQRKLPEAYPMSGTALQKNGLLKSVITRIDYLKYGSKRRRSADSRIILKIYRKFTT